MKKNSGNDYFKYYGLIFIGISAFMGGAIGWAIGTFGMVAIISLMFIFACAAIRAVYIAQSIFESCFDVWSSIIHLPVIFSLYLLRVFPKYRHNRWGVLLFLAQINNLLMIRFLIALDADLDVKDVNGYTALMLAALSGREKSIKGLIESGADLDVKDVNGYTALMLAALNGQEKSIKGLTESGADLDVKDVDGYTALMLAALNGQEKSIKGLTESGADLEARDNSGRTALMTASWNGHEKCVKGLIESGVDIEAKDNTGLTALMFAALSGQEKSIKGLTESGADLDVKDVDGYTALMLAALSGQEKSIDQLTTAGADLEAKDNNGRTALMRAALSGQEKSIDQLTAVGADLEVKDNSGKTALMCAAWKDHAECVDKLFKVGASLEAQDDIGCTALMYTALYGKKKSMGMLIAAGASLEAKDNNGCTSLMKAAWKDHAECIDQLFAAGVILDAKDNNGCVALMKAAWKGHVEGVCRLIAAGADLETRDNRGQTALMYAVIKGRKECIDKLITEGANVNHSDILGRTALMMGIEKEYSECVEALIAGGADSSKIYPEDTQWLEYRLQSDNKDFIIAKESYPVFTQNLTLIYAAVLYGNYNAVRLLARQGRLSEQLACTQEELLAYILCLNGGFLNFIRCLYESSIDIDHETFAQIREHIDAILYNRGNRIKQYIVDYVEQIIGKGGNYIDYLGHIIMLKESETQEVLAKKKEELGKIVGDIGDVRGLVVAEFIYRELVINGKTILESAPLIASDQSGLYKKKLGMELYGLHAFFLKLKEKSIYRECRILLSSREMLSENVSFPKMFDCRMRWVYQYAREQYGGWFKRVYVIFVAKNNRKGSKSDIPPLAVEMVDLIFSFLLPYYANGKMVIENPADRGYVESSKYSSGVLKPGEKRAIMMTENADEVVASGVNTGRLNKWFTEVSSS